MKRIEIEKPGGLDNLKFVDAEKPKPLSDEVLLKVSHSSLNYHDLLVAIGFIPTENKRVPLGDAGCTVEEIGESVNEWKTGDQVMSVSFPRWIDGPPKYEYFSFIGDNEDGYASEYMTIKANALTPIPNDWSLQEAATLPCAGLTAWRAIMEEGKLQPNETILVQGSGGVSIFALQLAKAHGANVIATTSSDEKAEKLKSLGADEVVNYKEHPQWGKEVLTLTANEGVDHVVEVAGGESFNESIRCAKLGGHISIIGILDGNTSEILLPRLFAKQLRTSGISMGSQKSQRDMVDFLNGTDIRPIISDTFKLEKLGEAFQFQMDNKHFGKISIEI